MGDLALGTFPLARVLGRPPAAIAQAWAEAVRAELARPDGALADLAVPVTRVETQGPYLNVTLEPRALARLVVTAVSAAGRAYGRARGPSGQTVTLEYSSPNTNKPLHLGHIRNNLIGMSLSNILEARGDRVLRVSFINDRGIHICKSMLAYLRLDAGGTPESTGEKGDHFVGRYYVLFDTQLKTERERFARDRGIEAARFSKPELRSLDKEARRGREEEADRFEEEFLAASDWMAGARDLLRRWEAGEPATLELWRRMNDWVYQGFRETYERLGCRFDQWYFESETWRIGKEEVERGLALGIFHRQPDGSVWARLESLGLKDKLVLRSDGTTVYITGDIGTAIRRFQDYRMDRSIYVVASEQDEHFRNLFAILHQLGHPWADRCHHASYGMVTLPHGLGKLKSREGVSVDADELLDELHRLAKQRIEEGGYCETPEAAERIAEWIGQGALKLYILQVSSEKNLQFDPNETIAFSGDTGPAVQYSHARICGILRKGLESGKVLPDDLASASSLDAGAISPVAGYARPAKSRDSVSGEPPSPLESPDSASEPPSPARRPDSASGEPASEGFRSEAFLRADRVDAGLLTEPEERDVLRLLAEYPDVVTQAARQLAPAPIANALLELTKAYARMYHQHEVLKAGSPELVRARLQLALCVAQVLRNGLGLLGIEAPERM